MRTDLLRRVGEALYGPNWQSALARDIGVNDRTMRRWAAGGTIPSTLADDLLLIVQARETDLRDVGAALAAELEG